MGRPGDRVLWNAHPRGKVTGDEVVPAPFYAPEQYTIRYLYSSVFTVKTYLFFKYGTGWSEGNCMIVIDTKPLESKYFGLGTTVPTGALE